MKGDTYIKTLAKIQVRGVFRIQDMRRNVLPKLIEICMEYPAKTSVSPRSSPPGTFRFARNVHIGEERGETDVSAGYVWRRHAGAHLDELQHGRRKPTETSVTEFCYNSVNLFFEKLINIKEILFLIHELFR